jgi:hypothetical protein
MRYVTIGRYQVSVVFLIIILIATSTVLGGAYYLWASRTMIVSIEEPLSIMDFPTSLNVHPGENQTINITIMNSATVNYSVTLVFALNDTLFLESYVTFSNYTYNITPSTNQIKAWIAVDKKAHAATLSLTVDFFRN